MRKESVDVINLNKYERVDVSNILQTGIKFVTADADNAFFYKLDDRYYGSPTNQAVINSYVNYIIGEGIVAREGINQNILDKIIDYPNLKNIILELKKTGNAPIQVIYSKQPTKKSVAKLYSIPTKNVAIENQKDLSEPIEGYWYCFDWKNKSKFKPYTVPAFKFGTEKESEIYYLKNNVVDPLFSMPDWVSGIQFAEMEEEISNYIINHVKNNFSAGKIINIFQGEPEDEEEAEEAERLLKRKLTSSINAGQPIVAFNRNVDERTEVENIEITDAYQQFEFVSEYSKTQIFTAHSVTSPSLFGADSNTGFSSDSEQMKTALNQLYRSQINPTRNKVIDALEEILRDSYPSIKLEFEDFDELKIDKEN